MKYSLIALAGFAASGQHPVIDDGEALPVPMTNFELPIEVAEIATSLEEIAENARYAADPSKPAADMARLMAAYFRTPDTLPATLPA